VAREEKQEMVRQVFAKVAEGYDAMNDAMSFGVHRYWKQEYVRMLGPTPGCTILDLAGGTGDISFRIIEAIRAAKKEQYQTHGIRELPASEVILSDINADMLEVGRERAEKLGYTGDDKDPLLTIQQLDAQAIPLPDNSLDAVTMAFGIRNCTDIDLVLREVHRVLRRGGRFVCLEFSEVTTPGLREAYDLWSFQAIPRLGKLISGDADSYQYLVESIRRFPPQETFAEMWRDAGFQDVRYENFISGVAAVHSGFKFD
jgi:ubiquinone/menaquinone biosynthesis methyltransferase